MEISLLGVQHELLAGLGIDRVTNSLDAVGESLVDALDISSLLHENDPQLLLFVEPDL